jgi:tetratricopeptide (TPR) repeat protein
VTERRILVIGSQCDRLNRLSFLPKAAEDLYAVMTDPDLGSCVPALSEGGLVLDPTVNEAGDIIDAAYKRASEDGATLLFAFIGHGEHVRNDFYLLPRDAPWPPMSHTAIHLVQRIKDLHGFHSNVDGLIVLLDTCYSGFAATEAAAQWVSELTDTLRFEVLTAAADRPAADGCFSRMLADILRTGIDKSSVGSMVYGQHVRPILIERCPKQLPQNPTFNAPPELFLAKNAAYQRKRPPWFDTNSASEVERLTAWFQPTPQLDAVVNMTRTSRCIAVFGDAGAGKSALTAALARPDVAAGKVPDRFVQAVAFLSEGTTSGVLADELARQFERSLPDFTAATENFRRSLTSEEWERRGALERYVVGPLRWRTSDLPVRLVIDGLDRLAPAANEEVYNALNALAIDPMLAGLHLLVMARPGTPVPLRAKRLDLGRADKDVILSYLHRRAITPTLHEAIVERTAGNWLVARLLADLAAIDPATPPAALPGDLAALYDGALHRAGATVTHKWRTVLRPVLGILAVSGIGPMLPLKLLCAASGKLGGPDRPTSVHDVLYDLRGFVARSAPGTNNEQVGLFHQTFAEYLLDPSTTFSIDPQDPHRALAMALDALAPMARHNATDPLHRYAAAREAEHLWAIEQYERALQSLKQRSSPIPAENLRRWRSWFARVHVELGADHPITLMTHDEVAYWTCAIGDAQTALRIERELKSHRERVLGPDHPDTLKSRGNIATWTGETGDARRALQLYLELLPDEVRVLGPDHPVTLTARGNIAHWIGKLGDAQEALRLYRELLPDDVRVLGPDHPNTLIDRGNMAHWIGELGDAQEALRLYRELLPDRERVLGPDHPDTLTGRSNNAHFIGATGDAQEALQLCRELLPDRERVLGPDHPDTLMNRGNIAHWTGKLGDAQGALQLYLELLPDIEHVLGPDHPDMLIVRSIIASKTGEVGDVQSALQLYRELLTDTERVLGSDHPDTLIGRSNNAHFIGATGDAQEALQLYRELLLDSERVHGPDHPTTLITRGNIVIWTAEISDAQEALRLYRELLPDRERVLGPDHPDTLIVRSNIASKTGEVGDAQRALQLCRELLTDRERVLGVDHPDTLTTRNSIAHWTAKMGDVPEALRLFRKLLPDRERVLGPDHPDTLTTRNNIADLTGEMGDAPEALRLFHKLLPDRERALGVDHPDTLTARNNITYWTAKTGDALEALRLLRELLPDLERVLGVDHPDTRNTKALIEFLTKNQV